MTKEAQEEYESSLNETLDNEKKSLSYAENCLKIEAQSLDCLIQKARLYYRAKNNKKLTSSIDEIKAMVAKSAYENLFQLYLDKIETPAEFKNRQIIAALPTQPNDRTLFYVSLETERSFEAKNYSRARELVSYSEKYYPNWPDLSFFRNKLNVESSEKQLRPEDDLMTTYQNKCKSISHSAARRFRYDFDLCNRGKK